MHHAYWLAAVGLLFAVLLAEFTPEGRRPVIYRKMSLSNFSLQPLNTGAPVN